MGARAYNTNTGRFSQTDPIPGGSANSYAYAAQNPLTESDLSGEWYMYEVSLPTNCNRIMCFTGRRNCDSATGHCGINWWMMFRGAYRSMWIVALNWSLYVNGWRVYGATYSHSEYGSYWFHGSWVGNGARGKYRCWLVETCYLGPYTSVSFMVNSPYYWGGETGEVWAWAWWS
jgi:hypothetical protein